MKSITEYFNELDGTLPVQEQSDKGVQPKSMKKSRGGNRDIPHKKWEPKLLPNVKEFKVIISNYDALFLAFGIEKRLPAEFEFKPHTNGSFNRYIKHQLRRMKALCKSNPLACWRIGMHLVRRSNVFFVMALNHVFPKWHRNMNLTAIIRLAIGVRQIANCHESKLDFTRIYIEKSNGGIRPLGVPTPAWRIYLRMLNVVLTYYLEHGEHFHDAQHGFRPNRGTKTAWMHILSNVIPSKDIFEFDLKSFFDKVNLDYIATTMVDLKIPINIVRLLYFINTCACKVKPPYLLNEFEHKMKSLLHKNATFKDVVEAPRGASYMYRVRGVPQGAPTSPILAALALHKSILDRGISTVMYADDGNYYGDIGDTPLITPNSGMVSANIHFNLEKSGWVKRDGKWLKPLKFLGLTYDGIKNELRASTRKGSTLLYDKHGLVLGKLEEWDRLAEDYPNNLKGEYTWEELIKSKLLGFIQSRLYQGSWNLDGYEQCFDLNERKGSLMHYMAKRRKITVPVDVFNSTTFASEWLVKKLSLLKYKTPPASES